MPPMGDDPGRLAGDAGTALEDAAAHAGALHAEATSAVHAAAHDLAHGGHEDHPPEPPTFLTILNETQHPAEGTLLHTLVTGPLHEPLPMVNKAPWDPLVFLGIAAGLSLALMILGTSQLRANRAEAIRRPTRWMAFCEVFVEALFKLVSGILGEKHARHYFPYIATLFILILVGNFMGLVPFLKPPTGSIVVTFSLALCTFVYVQFTAATRLGLGKYVYHLCGDPKETITYAMAPFIFLVEFVGVLVKPVSLSLRLFGNMLGKDILLGAFLMMGIMLMDAVAAPLAQYIGVPLTIPFYFLGILASVIQALVFAMLSTIYILLVLPHDHHDEHGHGDGHGHGMEHAAAH